MPERFGVAFRQDPGKHAAGANVSRKSLRWDWRLEANLNHKANRWALEGPSVGLYVPLLEFNRGTISKDFRRLVSRRDMRNDIQLGFW